jgi:hypothetical protein
MPMAATTSLFVTLVLGSVASAQTLPPAPVSWPPVTVDQPQPLPSGLFQNVDPVQFKPGGPEKGPEPKVEKPSRIEIPPGTRIQNAEGEADFAVQTEPPGLDRLTRRVSEAQFYEILRDDARRRPGEGRIYFPEEEPVSKDPYAPRQSPVMVRYVERSYVCHKPLYFEQKNFERYGWDLGMINPAIELGIFYYDLLLMPYHVGSDACHCFDCSAGKCLPGDPTPLLLYPERFSVTGLVFEAGTIFGGMFIFP